MRQSPPGSQGWSDLANPSYSHTGTTIAVPWLYSSNWGEAASVRGRGEAIEGIGEGPVSAVLVVGESIPVQGIEPRRTMTEGGGRGLPVTMENGAARVVIRQ